MTPAGTGNTRILLLEDDPNLGFMLQEHLESHGFRIDLRTTGQEGLAAVRANCFSLCLVDVMMPGMDGFTFVREFRKSDVSTPVIFLTARSLKEDRIEGFRIGGDDYVTKPFSMEELLLRIRAVLKRTTHQHAAAPTPESRRIGKYSVDSLRQELKHGNSRHPLTAKELEVLLVLTRQPNSVVLRGDILRTVWGEDTIYTSRSLDVFISRLRKLLAGDRSISLKSVHGKGYMLTVLDLKR